MSKVAVLSILFAFFAGALATPANASLVEAPGSPYPAGATTFAIANGDFNGDGLTDLAAPSEDSDDVTVLLRQPGGGYAPAPGSPFAVGERPADAVAADFNGDGRSDLAVANFGRQADGETATVLIAQPDGSFVEEAGSPITVGTAPTSVAATDVDRDGLTDLIVTTQQADAV